MYTYRYRERYTCIHIHISTYISVYVYACMCAYANAYIYMYIYMPREENKKKGQWPPTNLMSEEEPQTEGPFWRSALGFRSWDNRYPRQVARTNARKSTLRTLNPRTPKKPRLSNASKTRGGHKTGGGWDALGGGLRSNKSARGPGLLTSEPSWTFSAQDSRFRIEGLGVYGV